jgi:hypothetical protein
MHCRRLNHTTNKTWNENINANTVAHSRSVYAHLAFVTAWYRLQKKCARVAYSVTNNIKTYSVFMWTAQYFLLHFNHIRIFSIDFHRKFPKYNFTEIRPMEATPIHEHRRTKLIGAFRDYANTSEKVTLSLFMPWRHVGGRSAAPPNLNLPTWGNCLPSPTRSCIHSLICWVFIKRS